MKTVETIATISTNIISNLISEGWLILPVSSMQTGFISQVHLLKDEQEIVYTIKRNEIGEHGLNNVVEYNFELRTLENGWIKDLIQTLDSIATYKDKVVCESVEAAQELERKHQMRLFNRHNNTLKQFETKCKKQKKGFNGVVLVTRKRNGYQINTQFGKERLVQF